MKGAQYIFSFLRCHQLLYVSASERNEKKAIVEKGQVWQYRNQLKINTIRKKEIENNHVDDI